MLETLSGLNRRETQGILSSVALSLLPNPSSEPRQSVDEELYHRILTESREKLNVAPDDESAETRSRVADFLGNQISESILRGVDVDRIKARLGEAGYLRPDEYEANITSRFQDFVAIFRLNEAEVLNAIRHPDEVEHLPSVQQPDKSTVGLSICTKLFGAGRDTYMLIMILFRMGHVIEPHFAYRAFISDIDLRTAQSPLEMLKAFVERYGARFRLGNLPAAKFYQQEILPLVPGSPVDAYTLAANYVELMETAPDFFTNMMIRRINSLGLISFSIAFMVNLQKYRADLETHGISMASMDEILSKRHMNKMEINSLLKTTSGNRRILRRNGL